MRTVLVSCVFIGVTTLAITIKLGMGAEEAIDLHLDQRTAEQIAEIVLVKAYGKEVLRERPWTVMKTDRGYKFYGKVFPRDAEAGGAAQIEISRTNAAVISITHSK